MLSRTSKQTRDPCVCSSVIITEMVFHKLWNHSKYCAMQPVHVNDLKQFVVFRSIVRHLTSLIPDNKELLILFELWIKKTGCLFEHHFWVERLITWPFAVIENFQQNNKEERHVSKAFINNVLNSWCTFYDNHHRLAY